VKYGNPPFLLPLTSWQAAELALVTVLGPQLKTPTLLTYNFTLLILSIDVISYVAVFSLDEFQESHQVRPAEVIVGLQIGEQASLGRQSLEVIFANVLNEWIH